MPVGFTKIALTLMTLAALVSMMENCSPAANLHRFNSYLKSDEELLHTIEHGIVYIPMHAWRGELTDGEMQDVVAYIRLLSQQGR